ncbi:ficolin-1-like [Drosophila obscura]|uniref:ficolin-1-like n=1 Tax=Drosophila obscura TaxID=7282 RepID=UPI001BB24CCC|nr:ficolin-1-like [Drosophila obscura]
MRSHFKGESAMPMPIRILILTVILIISMRRMENGIAQSEEQTRGDIEVLAIQNPNSQCPLGPRSHGIYTVILPSIDPFKVSCDENIADPGWTVIARRTNGELNFLRNWMEYKSGFGDLRGDFSIGLDAITKSQTQELYVHLEGFKGNTRFARYDEFYIESENDLYRMSKLGAYTGYAGDSMYKCTNQQFTTYDRDNDRSGGNCGTKHVAIGIYIYICTL